MNFVVSIMAAGVLASAATVAIAQDAANTATSAAAPSVAAGHIPPPPAGKSQVVFFRTGAYMGGATWFKIRESGAELGKLSNQAYFVAVLDPGPHTFTAATENKTTLKMELDADETYYVRGTLQMGVILYEPNLAPADQDLFEKHYAHMHVVRFIEPEAPKDAAKPAS
jgi:hypothetical protein